MHKYIMSLEIRGLSIATPHHVIISSVNFSLRKDGFTSILGPSGSGKTTLIKAILGLAQHLNICGEISFDGKILQRNQHLIVPLRVRRFAYIPQALTLWPHLSVNKALTLCAYWSGCFDSSWLQEIIELTGLRSHLSKKPSALSGGEQQRLALARVLVAKPRLIIFDEALSALDLVAKAHLIKLIKEAKKNIEFSGILITHDVAEAQALSSDIMLLVQGQKIWEGPQENLPHAVFPPDWPLLESPFLPAYFRASS